MYDWFEMVHKFFIEKGYELDDKGVAMSDKFGDCRVFRYNKDFKGLTYSVNFLIPNRHMYSCYECCVDILKHDVITDKTSIVASISNLKVEKVFIKDEFDIINLDGFEFIDLDDFENNIYVTYKKIIEKLKAEKDEREKIMNVRKALLYVRKES